MYALVRLITPHPVPSCAGVSSLLADALSMGVGDALSSQAEVEVAKRERERERWELENFKEGEIKEVIRVPNCLRLRFSCRGP